MHFTDLQFYVHRSVLRVSVLRTLKKRCPLRYLGIIQCRLHKSGISNIYKWYLEPQVLRFSRRVNINANQVIMPSIYQCIWHFCKLVAANLSISQHHSHKINVMVFVHSLYVSMCFSKTYFYSNIAITRQINFTNDTIWSFLLLAWQSMLLPGINWEVLFNGKSELMSYMFEVTRA